MAISKYRLFFIFISSAFLCNLYFGYQFLVQYEYSPDYIDEYEEKLRKASNSNINDTNKLNSYEKKDNEFLVLDWTGTQHIFQEKDPIECNFSSITPLYCQSKFDLITNSTLRLYFIERCSRLSTLIIRWSRDRSFLKYADLIAYHSIQMPFYKLPELIRNNEQQQFSTVYVLESEANTYRGDSWHKIDFPMWYNLERSYPEPITYFDISAYLSELFSPIQVPFSEKIQTASIVWISTNCHAYNDRQVFIKKLMSYIRVDSYGRCLDNIKSKTIKARQQPNSMIYSKYKFVIAIENSNCEDYVTEKLLQALASTSIPIVASRDGKPDYTRFAPKHSYINIYDYKSIKDLADYLKYLSINETAYNEYLWFRQLPANRYTALDLQNKTLNEYLKIADEILGENATMKNWILTKETGINKYCKLTRFIYTNSWDSIFNRKRLDRPTPKEVCLPEHDLSSYFSI